MSRSVVGALALLGLAVGGLLWWVATSGEPAAGPPAKLDHSRPKPQGGELRTAYPEPADFNPFTTVGAVTRRRMHHSAGRLMRSVYTCSHGCSTTPSFISA